MYAQVVAWLHRAHAAHCRPRLPPLAPAPPPFLLIYVAPDIANDLDSSCLAHPPIFKRDGDGLIACFRGHDGYHPAGRVRAIHRAGAVALVELDHLADEDDPRLSAVVLVRADAIPPTPAPAQARLAACLRERYGDTLTADDVAAVAVVTINAVYQAINKERIQSTKQQGRRLFTPEQAAAWLVRRGAGRAAT